MSDLIKKQNQINPESYQPKKPEILNLAKQIQSNSTYPETFILQNKSTVIPPEIKHYGPAYVSFANEFSNFLDYTGNGYGFLFDGDWCKDRSYTIANILSGHAMEPSNLLFKEGIEFLWKTTGFTSCCTFYSNPENSDYLSKQEIIEMIKYSLVNLKQPVIIPFESHWWGSIVIGYKDNGNILLIYHYLPHFMNLDNNAQPIIEEINDWYNNNISLFIAGKRENILSMTDIYRLGFKRIYSCLKENIKGEKQRYYDEWESFLRLTPEEMITTVKCTGIVPGGNHGTLDKEADNENVWEFICNAHDSTWCDMAERRYYIMNFFRQAKEFFPEAKDILQKLDDHFWHVNVIMGDQEKGYGSEVGDPVNPEIFKKTEVRSRMADCVKQFKEADSKGFEMVEDFINHFNI